MDGEGMQVISCTLHFKDSQGIKVDILKIRN